MKGQAPKINPPRAEGPTVADVAAHVLRRVAKRNPLAEAIVDEMSPEIEGVLQKHLGGTEMDLSGVSDVISRANGVIQRVAQKGGKTA